MNERPIAERVQSYIDRELQPVAVTIRPDQVIPDAKLLLLKVFPEWLEQEVDLKAEQDGVTNVLLRCTRTVECQKTVVLIRIYGNATETMIYRDREMRNFVSLHLNGYAPRLLKRFLNGLVYEFVPGRVLSKLEMADPLYSRAVARLLGAWHRDMPHASQSQFWPIVRDWLRQIPPITTRSHQTAQTITEKMLRSEKRKEWLEEHLNWLQEFANGVSDVPVFSHNDLLHANIIVQDDPALDGEIPNVAFIDYEYGCSNDYHFDIANHMLEFAGFECNWDALPSEELQHSFVEAYLQSYKEVDSIEVIEIDAEVEKVRAYFAVSHFYWYASIIRHELTLLGERGHCYKQQYLKLTSIMRLMAKRRSRRSERSDRDMIPDQKTYFVFNLRLKLRLRLRMSTNPTLILLRSLLLVYIHFPFGRTYTTFIAAIDCDTGFKPSSRTMDNAAKQNRIAETKSSRRTLCSLGR